MSDSAADLFGSPHSGCWTGGEHLLRLPEGGWGVVDCCASSNSDESKNSTLEFLRSRSITDLEFLCLTHPHADHYKGMSTCY